ncbi:WD repeat-containing protein 27 isoform X4 [Phyllostomus hastatus]|uniref:WD repeat-containing protein 27 isoform X4 n=1 Tax=Phyllostomus hastatus TaxID=9423 RepID=UPI001E683629|nr:WD repeat-containing protein 27 isoform X4 [Phyllostomus hastatus]
MFTEVRVDVSRRDLRTAPGSEVLRCFPVTALSSAGVTVAMRTVCVKEPGLEAAICCHHRTRPASTGACTPPTTQDPTSTCPAVWGAGVGARMEGPQSPSERPGGGSGDIVTETRLVGSWPRASPVPLACRPPLCAFPARGPGLCVWSSTDPAGQLLVLRGHRDPVTAVAFGNAGSPPLVCSASPDCVVTWRLDECREQALRGVGPRGAVLGTLLGKVPCVRFRPDDRAAAVCAGNQVLLLDVEARSVLAQLQGHQGPVTAAEFCPWQPHVLVSVAEDRCFKVWDSRMGSLLHSSPVLTAAPLLSLCMDEQSQQLVAGCAEGQLCVCSLVESHRYRCVTRVDLRKQVESFRARMAGPRPCGWPEDSELPSADAPGRGDAVDATLPALGLARCDLARLRGPDRGLSLPAASTGGLWVGSSTGSFLLNLANFELEAVLLYEDFRHLSIQVAGSCAVTSGDEKAFCLLASMFGGEVALLEVDLAALVRSQQRPLPGTPLSVLPSSCVSPTSPLRFGVAAERWARPGGHKRAAARGAVRDQPLVFHSSIRSSGYAAAPHAATFSRKTAVKGGQDRSSGRRNVHQREEYPSEKSVPTTLRRQLAVPQGPAAVCCVQFSGDGRRLACGLANHVLLVFGADLTGAPAVFSGHDGAVSTLDWSHDGRWLLSASQDGTLRLWSARSREAVLCLGKAVLAQPVRAAQFYYLDAFLLLSAGPELLLLKYHVDTRKDEMNRYKQRSGCSPVFRLPMAGAAEITCLSAVNEFYSHLVLAAGRNRAVEVFDLNAGRSAAVVAGAHTRPVHQICQNKVRAPIRRPPQPLLPVWPGLQPVWAAPGQRGRGPTRVRVRDGLQHLLPPTVRTHRHRHHGGLQPVCPPARHGHPGRQTSAVRSRVTTDLEPGPPA